MSNLTHEGAVDQEHGLTVYLRIAIVLFVLVVSALGAVAAQEKPPNKIERLLDTNRVTVDFTSVDLPTVLDHFTQETGIPWIFDGTELPNPQDLLITIHVRDMLARDFLSLALAPHELFADTSSGQALVVTTLESRRKLTELRTFDLRPLVDCDFNSSGLTPGFLEPIRRLRGGAAATFPCAQVERNWSGGWQYQPYSIGEIQSRLQAFVEPDSWSSASNMMVEHSDTHTLVVRHRPDVLQEVERVLALFIERMPGTCRIDWGIADLPFDDPPKAGSCSALAAKIGGAGSGKEPLGSLCQSGQVEWRIRRRMPTMESWYGPRSAAGEVRPTSSESEDVVAASLQPEIHWYRKAGRERVVMQARVDCRIRRGGRPAVPARDIDVYRLDAYFDLGDHDMAVVPMALAETRDGRQGVRAFVLRVELHPRATWADETEPPAVPEPPDIAAALDRTISLKDPPVNLDGLVEMLRAALKCNVVLGSKATELRPGEGRFRGSLVEVPARTALTLLTRPYRLAWTVRHGAVVIDSPLELEPVGRVQVLDGRDLLCWPLPPPAPVLRRAASGDPTTAAEDLLSFADAEPRNESANGPHITEPDDPAYFIRTVLFTEPSPREDLHLACDIDSQGYIWIRHTPSVVREARALLARLRENLPRPVGVEYALVAVPRQNLPGVDSHALPRDEIEKWWGPQSGSEILHAGALVGRTGSSASSASALWDIDESADAEARNPRQRGAVVAVGFGDVAPNDVLSMAVGIDWDRAGMAHSAQGPAAGIRHEIAGYEGRLCLRRGETDWLALGELADGRSLIALIRWNWVGD